jgi:protein-L-isoaspartate(D-aspartate) O-methyltransferase
LSFFHRLLFAFGLAALNMGATLAADPTQSARDRMVDLIADRGLDDPVVLGAMRRFPRHELVPSSYRDAAYDDRPLPIGMGQTISQPYMVAYMTHAAHVGPGDKVLEIGTGSGYQAAILALCGAQVFTIEIIPELAERARADLARLGIRNVAVRVGDGYAGWPQEAPFAAIVVTAAPESAPPALLAQLAQGGRLVIPEGPAADQYLDIYTRHGSQFVMERTFAVRFVPLVSTKK